MKDLKSSVLCTVDDGSDCQSCSIQYQLVCKWNEEIKNSFLSIGFPPILITIFGLVIVGMTAGLWWPLITFVVYFITVLGIFEIRFLCSHCPYYAAEGKTLHCLANHGSFKWWRYHPGPMNKLEQFLMSYIVVAMIYFILPLAGLGYGVVFLSTHYADFGLIALLGMAGITFAVFLNSISFVSILKTFFCTQCVNFSCPLNRVPKKVVDEYLKKNPVMKEAWGKSGYIVGP